MTYVRNRTKIASTISDIFVKRGLLMNIQLSEHFTYRKLLKFTFPSMVMMVFTSIYGIVDGVFVSNFVGKDPFAAINLIMPFLMILGALGFMIGSGGSALVAATMGSGDEKQANGIFSMLIYALIGFGLVFMILGIAFLEPVSRFLGADEVLLPYCVTYGRIILLAMIPFMLQNVFQSFLVTAERPDLGLYVTIAAGVTNMVLDALFIAVFKMGIAGAAIATVISQYIGGMIPFLYFVLPNKGKLHLGKAVWEMKYFMKACTNGASEFMTNISMSIVTMLYNWQLMRLMGADGVTIYGIIMYVDFIFVGILLGYSMGSAPVVSYHYGAENREELKGLFKRSLTLIVSMNVILMVSAEVLSRPLSMIFVSYNTELLDMTTMAFRIYAISFLLMGINIYASSFFTALNDGKTSAIISFCRTMIFECAAVLILPIIFDINGIWGAIILAELLSATLSVFCFIRNAGKYGYI